MIRQARIAGIGLLLVATPTLASEENATNIALAALAGVEWEFERDWAFTETSWSDETLRVGRFDPARPLGERWTLLEIDNRPPTLEEREAYVDEKADEQATTGKNIDAGILELIDIDSLELVDETPQHWRFGFSSLPDADDEDSDILAALDGQLVVAKRDGQLLTMRLQNSAPIRPIAGAKIRSMTMAFRFVRAAPAGPVVLGEVDVRVQGSAFIVVRFDESESIRFSDFTYRGDSPP